MFLDEKYNSLQVELNRRMLVSEEDVGLKSQVGELETTSESLNENFES